MRDSIGGIPASRLLFLSLLGNLFLIAFMAVQFLEIGRPPAPPMPPPPPAMMVERLATSVSDEGRVIIMSIYEQRQKTLDALFGELGHAQLQTQQVFSGESFDEAGYKAAILRRKEAADRFFSEMADMFMEIGRQLSPEDRREALKRGRF